jgi:phosphate/sulfate permease
MTYRQDIVFSLILAPIRSGLRGFCLFNISRFLMEYQQKNPLKYYALPFLMKQFFQAGEMPLSDFTKSLVSSLYERSVS